MDGNPVTLAADRMLRKWLMWHDPLIVPPREWLEEVVTDDFTILCAMRDANVICRSIDEYIELVRSQVDLGYNVRLSWEIIGGGSQYCFAKDLHEWTIGGQRFSSERIDVLEERDGKISRVRVLTLDPFAFEDWWQRSMAGRVATSSASARRT